MIQNKNNIQLTSLEENAVKLLHSVITTILGEKAFTISIGITEGAFCEKYLELDFPLRPEDGEKISPIYIIMKKSGVFFLEYFQNVECSSYERGCIASNTITDSIKELPIKCIYYENQRGFYLSSVFHFPDSIITVINSVLLALEYIIILTPYLDGTATDQEAEKAFDAIAAGGGYVNHSRFEDFNIVK